MNHWIEISESSLIHNITVLKKIIKNKKIGAVLKSNAYGHGIEVVASLLEKNNFDGCYFVSSLEEALVLREKKIVSCKKEIILLSELISNELIEYCINNCIIPIVYSLIALKIIDLYTKKNNKHISIHLKFETGMHRLGIMNYDHEEVFSIIKHNSYIIVKGICSHCSESTLYETSLIQYQKKKFDEIIAKFSLINNCFETHLSSSGGSDVLEHDYTLLRTGSSLYGLWKSDEHKKRVNEKYSIEYYPIMTWKSKIIDIKTVPAESYVGYSQSFKTQRESKIAFLPCGYYHGYSRLLSHKAGVIINGKYAPLCGFISMNMITVDVTDIYDIGIDANVLLISGLYEETKVDTLAKIIGVPNITFTSCLSDSIKRISVD
jgi:alanine racemase